MKWVWGRLAIFLFSTVTSFALANEPAHQLILCGGGVEPKPALKEFVTRAGGETARLVFLSFASGYPEIALEGFHEKMGPFISSKTKIIEGHRLRWRLDSQGVPILDEELAPEMDETIPEREQAKLIKRIEEGSGLWLSGGDQDRFMRVVNRYPAIKDAILNFYQSGKVIAGTSAGTAVAAKVMMSGSRKKNSFWTLPGLGFISAIVDQHFFVRDRLARLRESVDRLSPQFRYGLGIDEDAAVLILNDRTIQVLPEGSDALIIDNSRHPSEQEIRLKSGETFVLEV